MKHFDKFKKFYDKYKKIEALKESDYIEYIKQKEILFIKDELKKISKEKTDYSRLEKYYKRRLVDYGVMKEIKCAKSYDKKYFGKTLKKLAIA